MLNFFTFTLTGSLLLAPLTVFFLRRMYLCHKYRKRLLYILMDGILAIWFTLLLSSVWIELLTNSIPPFRDIWFLVIMLVLLLLWFVVLIRVKWFDKNILRGFEISDTMIKSDFYQLNPVFILFRTIYYFCKSIFIRVLKFIRKVF